MQDEKPGTEVPSYFYRYITRDRSHGICIMHATIEIGTQRQALSYCAADWVTGKSQRNISRYPSGIRMMVPWFCNASIHNDSTGPQSYK